MKPTATINRSIKNDQSKIDFPGRIASDLSDRVFLFAKDCLDPQSVTRDLVLADEISPSFSRLEERKPSLASQRRLLRNSAAITFAIPHSFYFRSGSTRPRTFLRRTTWLMHGDLFTELRARDSF